MRKAEKMCHSCRYWQSNYAQNGRCLNMVHNDGSCRLYRKCGLKSKLLRVFNYKQLPRPVKLEGLSLREFLDEDAFAFRQLLH